jgi:hypothetical protein
MAPEPMLPPFPGTIGTDMPDFASPSPSSLMPAQPGAQEELHTPEMTEMELDSSEIVRTPIEAVPESFNLPTEVQIPQASDPRLRNLWAPSLRATSVSQGHTERWSPQLATRPQTPEQEQPIIRAPVSSASDLVAPTVDLPSSGDAETPAAVMPQILERVRTPPPPLSPTVIKAEPDVAERPKTPQLARQPRPARPPARRLHPPMIDNAPTPSIPVGVFAKNQPLPWSFYVLDPELHGRMAVMMITVSSLKSFTIYSG